MIILHTESSPGWGGQELRIRAEVAEMRRRGHDVHLAVCAHGEFAKRLAADGEPHHLLRFRHRFGLDTVLALRGLIRRLGATVLNTHSSTDSWAGALATRGLPGVTLVRTRHLSIPVKRNLLTRWLYTRPAAVVTTGEALREQLIRDNGMAPGRLLSIATGFDPARFDPATQDRAGMRAALGIAADEPVVVMVAMVRPMKGHPVLVEAAPLVLKQVPRARFLVVGGCHDDNPMPAKLKQMAEANGSGARFIWAGQRQDIPAIYAASDVKVLPSVSDEGVPQSLTQALAMGLPTVSTTVGAIGEIVEDGVTGWQVRPGDPVALAAAIVQALTDQAEATRRAHAGQQRVLARYTVVAMAARTEALYARLAAGRPAWPEEPLTTG